MVDSATGEQHPTVSYPIVCFSAGTYQCPNVPIWSGPKLNLVHGKSYYARYRIRPGSTQADWSPWWTTAAHPAVYTPGIPPDLSGLCTCPDEQEHRGDPVNTATGAFTESYVDVAGTGPGVALQVARFYSSLSTRVSPFGKGWSWPYDSALTASTSEVVVRASDGATVRFTKDTSGAWVPPASVTTQLRQVGSGWEVRDPDDDSRYQYGADGRLTGIVDAGGIGVALGYDAGRLSTITERSGRVATVSYSGDRISRIALSDGRQVSYEYTGDLLTRAADVRGGTTAYGYDGQGRITTVTDHLGREITKNVYDATTGRVTSQTGPTGHVTRFEWDAANGEADTIDPNGGVWTDVYAAGVLVAQYDPTGASTVFDYDNRLNRIAVEDARLNRTTMTYDARGNMLSRTAPAPLSYLEKWSYDAADNVLSHTDGRGKITSYTYDAANRVTKQTFPDTTTNTFAYTALGQLASKTTGRGNTWTYGYDAAGNLVRTTSPLGHATTMTYDAAGRVASTTDPRGNQTGGTPEDFTTHTTYDAAGNVMTITSPDDSVTTNTYDPIGNLTGSVQTDASGNELSRTGYAHDVAKRVLTETRAGRVVAAYGYDSRGNRISVTDATGAKTTSTFDAANRVATMTRPRGNATGGTPAAHTWIYRYDENGNQTEEVLPTGQSTKFEYDVLNRVSIRRSPLGFQTKFGYDGGGNVLTQTDHAGQVTTYTYDAIGRRASEALPGLQPRRLEYDADGQLTKETTPSGGSITTWTYDADGRRVTQTDPRGYVAGATPAHHTTTFGYDAAGNQVTLKDKLTRVTTRTYDARNNLTAERDPRGNTTNRGYDALQRLVSVASPAGGTTAYTYDAFGDLIKRTNPRGAVTTYGYNTRGDLTSIIDPLNRKKTFGYDPDGNLTETINARGYASGDLATWTVKQSYDARGLRTAVTTASAASSSTFGYDADGRMTSYKDATGTTTQTWNSLNQLTGTTHPQGNYVYTYAPFGAVASRNYPGGGQANYTFDGDGRIKSMAAYGQTTNFAYDADHHLTTVGYPASSGYVQTRAYDRAGDLAWVRNQKNGVATPLSRYDYTRDLARNPVLIKRTRGAVVTDDAYEYDAANRLTKVCSETTSCASATKHVTYAYDEAGNRLSETRVGVAGPGAISTTYDIADQMTSRKNQAGTVTNFTHNADGFVQDSREWDVLGRLTMLGTASFGYDAMDLRRTVQNAAGTKKMSWDVNNPLPLLSVVTRADGSYWRNRYTPDGWPMYAEHPSKTYAFSLMMHDNMSSVTDIVDQTGAGRWRFAYDPYGIRTEGTKLQTVAEDPEFGFTGAYRESATGEFHLRARDYNNVWGRFAAPDPLTPDIDDPHVSTYLYANQRPTILTDPSGLTPDPSDIWGAAKQGATWAFEGAVGSVGGLVDLGQLSNPIGAGVYLLGYQQSDLYYAATNRVFGVSGNELSTQIGEFFAPIPGGGAIIACKSGSKWLRLLIRSFRPKPNVIVPKSIVVGQSRVQRVVAHFGDDVVDTERAVKTPHGSTDIDVVLKDGTYIEIGGPMKAANLAKFGQQLQRIAWAAKQAGGKPIFMYDKGTPQKAIDLAKKWFGPDGARPIP